MDTKSSKCVTLREGIGKKKKEEEWIFIDLLSPGNNVLNFMLSLK